MAAIVSTYEKIIKYIDEHIKNDITLDEISKYAGYSQGHLYKIFKIYSPVSVMAYVRNKKLCAAANEIYTGRKLYEVALDYGYETPSGFYKAFKSVFGCRPGRYKNNKTNETRSLFMNIENVKTIKELNEVLKFFNKIYPNHPIGEIDPWVERLNKHPELLLYAKEGDKICAATFGIGGDNGWVTIDEGVLEDYWNTGIFEALFIELEKRAKKLGYIGLVLGIGEGQEEFYAKLGYTGNMLVQSEKHSIDDLKDFLAGLNDKTYEITQTRIHDGYINQIWLKVSILDKDLKKKFEQDLGDCRTQIVVLKWI